MGARCFAKWWPKRGARKVRPISEGLCVRAWKKMFSSTSDEEWPWRIWAKVGLWSIGTMWAWCFQESSFHYGWDSSSLKDLEPQYDGRLREDPDCWVSFKVISWMPIVYKSERDSCEVKILSWMPVVYKSMRASCEVLVRVHFLFISHYGTHNGTSNVPLCMALLIWLCSHACVHLSVYNWTCDIEHFSLVATNWDN